MSTKGKGYPTILGRPRLMAMKAKQDWGTSFLKMQDAKGKEMFCNMKTSKQKDLCLETSVDDFSTDSTTTSYGKSGTTKGSDGSIEVMAVILNDLNNVNPPYIQPLVEDDYRDLSGGTPDQSQGEKKTSSIKATTTWSDPARCPTVRAAYQYPRLSRFCYSAEDQHSEYGLSLKGKLPRDIADDEISDKKGGLERKINKFHADYGIVKLEVSNCDVAVSSIPTISTSKLEGRQVVEQPMYMQQKTKDGSCCLDSYDEDHSDHFDSFQMKGIALDDIANVLQGMAKVTTKNSPILVLEEPSSKMDNASTLVEDKDKNSTVDPPINFSIDVPPVHEGEDHEKNTTLDPVSKVSINSTEGDQGKDKIVDPASKLSANNPKESEARDDIDDPELGKTLRFMAAQMKKNHKQELEEGPANPNRSTKPAHPKARACKKL
ncbi:hypothetical protein L7F22_069397 [Adiantum nelumboides]|nr:hypothetical protein [Adiantum nelumboides]